MPEETEDSEPAIPEKLLIDDVSDFQFHAAYIAYSETYDKTSNLETKRQLNNDIEALQQSKIDYQAFYSSISKYRAEASSGRIDRSKIRTQKKRDWRKQTRSRERNKRYRK